MAEHHPLQHWLESIELPNYYLNFTQHNIITRDDCKALNAEKLTEIGITLSGHQRRILSHLPDDKTWPDNIFPILPPKTKSVRDSYLFQDGYANTAHLSADGSAEKERLTPKPVPRPRSNRSPVPSFDDKPKAAPRPKPAPRKNISPQNHKAKPLDSQTDSKSPLTVTSNNISGNTHSDRVANELDKTVVSKTLDLTVPTLDFLPTSATDKESHGASSPVTLELGSSSNVDHFDKTNDSLHSGTVVNTFTLEGVCDDETCTEASPDKAGTNDNECDDIYINVETRKTVTAGQDETATNASPKVQKDAAAKTSSYVNVAPFLKSVKDSVGQLESEKLLTGSTSSVTEHDTPDVKQRPEHSVKDNEDREEAEETQSDIYEPIWGDKQNEGSSKETAVRTSNLILFSPFCDKKSSNLPRNRLSTFGTRTSVAFNLPPPEYSPPPLPGNPESSQIDTKDLLLDFDPLAIPAVPPRPQNYRPPNFNVYQNVSFYNSGGSVTLPGTDQDMEPVTLCSPDPIGYDDAAISCTSDPFNKVDPFGEFKPDESDFSPDSFPPTSCRSETFDNTFINPETGSAFGNPRTSDIYEVTEEPFDPFGLNAKPGDTFLTRSESSGSGSSIYRLSEVPPAPKWPHNVPQGNWFQSSNTSSVYSLAIETRKYLSCYERMSNCFSVCIKTYKNLLKRLNSLQFDLNFVMV